MYLAAGVVPSPRSAMAGMRASCEAAASPLKVDGRSEFSFRSCPTGNAPGCFFSRALLVMNRAAGWFLLVLGKSRQERGIKTHLHGWEFAGASKKFRAECQLRGC